MKPLHTRLFLKIILFILLLSVIFLFFFFRLCFAEYKTETFTETTEELSNPYIGWYSIQGFMLSDDEELSLPAAEEESKSSAGLTLVEINLLQYADSDISEQGLQQLDELLSALQDTGQQLILRFLYDWNGENLETEPDNIDQILRHMEQTAEIVNKYADSVYIMQGIFVGNIGEMNNTIHMANGGTDTLIQKLASVTDPSIFLAVRTPAQLRSILKTADTPDESTAFTGTLSARLGLFNDGMLGSVYDTGTYGVASAETSSYDEKWVREDEIAYQNQLCNYVPNGGEVIIDNPYNDLENAVTDLRAMHVSYLNRLYDQAVLSKWENSVYEGSDTIYQGMTGLEYISCHLGYRYVLRDSSLTWNPLTSSSGSLSVTIENVGFSPSYREFDVNLVLVPDDGGASVTVSADTDTRFWTSGETITLDIDLDIRNMTSGSYSVYLQIMDPVLAREILLANDSEHTEYGYKAGSLTISKPAK